jgi:putative ABC transport system ATP-binding protein
MIALQNCIQSYNRDTVVNLPDIRLGKGENLLVTGLSGSGKSTLLHILAGILHPTQGTYQIDGSDLLSMSESERDRYRGTHIGIVYQQMHLVTSLNVANNIQLARYMAGLKPDLNRVKQVCETLDIGNKLNSYPNELSQGQKQRVAIARAVVNDPVLLLADEPTSSLDDLRSENVINLLKESAAISGASLIVSTHDSRVKKHFENVLDLESIEQDEVNA